MPKHIINYGKIFNMETKKHVCIICGHVHDIETEGDWDNLPVDFACPECGCSKEDYELI